MLRFEILRGGTMKLLTLMKSHKLTVADGLRQKVFVKCKMALKTTFRKLNEENQRKRMIKKKDSLPIYSFEDE